MAVIAEGACLTQSQDQRLSPGAQTRSASLASFFPAALHPGVPSLWPFLSSERSRCTMACGLVVECCELWHVYTDIATAFCAWAAALQAHLAFILQMCCPPLSFSLATEGKCECPVGPETLGLGFLHPLCPDLQDKMLQPVSLPGLCIHGANQDLECAWPHSPDSSV